MALSVRAASNLFISVVGAGVLGLPYAFRRSGLVQGTIVMVIIAALNLHCMLLLVSLITICHMLVFSTAKSCRITGSRLAKEGKTLSSCIAPDETRDCRSVFSSGVRLVDKATGTPLTWSETPGLSQGKHVAVMHLVVLIFQQHI